MFCCRQERNMLSSLCAFQDHQVLGVFSCFLLLFYSIFFCRFCNQWRRKQIVCVCVGGRVGVGGGGARLTKNLDKQKKIKTGPWYVLICKNLVLPPNLNLKKKHFWGVSLNISIRNALLNLF